MTTVRWIGLLILASRVSAGDEMNLVLLKLVEYLGHTNPLICGLAYDEVSISTMNSSESSSKSDPKTI